MAKKSFKKEEWNKPATVGLMLTFTDEVLIPRFDDMIDEKMNKKFAEQDKRIDAKFAEQDKKISRVEYNIKEYIDKKMADYTSDIFKRLEKREHKEGQFKKMVVELFKTHHIGSSEQVAFLEGLVVGSL